MNKAPSLSLHAGDTFGRPRHRRCRHFVTSGLFDGLENFADLEARIAALPTKRERGDAFEVFAEAYLATQTIVGAEEVWPADLDSLAAHSYAAQSVESVA